MDCADLNDIEDEETIEACRGCGIYFINGIIHPIFTKTGAGENSNGNMPEIVQLMNEWNLQVKEDDGRPQNMCKMCIVQFQKVLEFKRSCLETQEQFNDLDFKKAFNSVVIKKEIEPEEKFCGYIYLDDTDDSEEDGSGRVCAPLDIPHVPIKQEHTARVPQESPAKPAVEVVSNLPEKAASPGVLQSPVLEQKPIPPSSNPASLLLAEAIFSQVKPQDLAAANGLSATLFEDSQNESQDSEDEIIKFTYEDDCDGEELTTLPAPIQDSGVFCKLCGHSSITQEQHTDHMNRIHMLKDCECHICGKKFVNAHESRLRFHMKFHKLQKHLKCPICGFFCNSKDTLKEHKLAVHTRAKCEFCGKRMKQQQLSAHLNRHIKEHEEELAMKLKAMQTIQTPASKSPEPCLIQCAFCEITVSDADQLQAHVLEMHNTTPASPPVEPDPEPELLESNDVSMATLNLMDSSNSSTQSEVVMYNCHICSKTFNLKIKLNRHLQQHSNVSF